MTAISASRYNDRSAAPAPPGAAKAARMGTARTTEGLKVLGAVFGEA